MLLFSVFIFASWLILFEFDMLFSNKEIREQGALFNSIYMSVITITSVGYGDIYPNTVPGKCVVMLMSIWGAVMLSFIVLFVSNSFSLTEMQEDAMHHIDRNKVAAKTISRSLKYFNLKKKLHVLIQKSAPKSKSTFLQ